MNRRFVDEAMEILLPSIDELLKKSRKKVFSWVVIDPRSKDEPSVLAEGSVGDSNGLDDYYWIALNKAVQAWINASPNRFVPAIDLCPGDTPHYGSWFEEGLAIGVSGLKSCFNEAIAHLMVVTILGLARIELEIWKEDNPEEDFLP